ncbi:N-acetylmuramoyl-L-alanine amidase [Haloimpatiens sp. FM7315]|uniref:N-acetylmuramoyl-L-alanine amidase n=1 Tax=Haloimpatiens sp. FM7315 TaxID=3298609 RepID=UPI00370BCF1F
MKYGIDIGHNCSFDKGAVGIKKEDELNREVGIKVIQKLRALGHEVIECTPKTSSSLQNSLSQRVSKANLSKVDLFISIHFNAGGGKGSEIYAISSEGKTIASKILKNIVALGYVDRGVKDGSRLYVVRKTNMIAMLIECCFVDSKEDMSRYNAEAMAEAIVKALDDRKTTDSKDKKKDEIEVKEIRKDNLKILRLQRLLNKLKIGDMNGKSLVEDGIFGAKTLAALIKFQYIVNIKPSKVFDEDTEKAINKILLTPLLKTGNTRYIETRYLQWRLQVYIDGVFGYKTRAAVIKFQAKNSLVTDGVVGKNTWNILLK